MKYLNDIHKFEFAEGNKLKNYMRCFTTFLLYNSGGHSLHEFTSLFQLTPVREAFAFIAGFKHFNEDTLFHIGNADMVSGEDIVQAIRKKFPGANIEIVKTSNPMPYPDSRLSSDFSRAKEQLGYEPDYPIDKAVADYGATLKKLENL